MNKLLQPSIIGQITECSRSVMFQNAEPGAKIILTRTRNGRSDDVGETRPVTISSGIVTLQNGEKFKTGDRVSIYQMTPTETSPPSFPDVEVQANVENYNIAVLDGLYSCSRVLTLGGMRAGGKVELLNGTSVIGTGVVDGEGVAYVYVDSGLPSEGTILTARLHFCPNPPPPSGASEYVKDIPLPRVGAPTYTSQVHGNQLDPPVIASGLYTCSGSLQLKNIVPGAIVFIVPTNRNWKESGTFLTTESCVELPVNLDKDTVVEIWQELGRDQCGGITSKRESYPPVKDKNPPTLDQPKLNAIYCNSSNLFACGIKLKANIEIEVTFQGNVTTYRTVASDSDCTDNSDCTDPNNAVPIPAPPQLSDGATVRIRQGECDNWSAWSNSESVQKVSAVATPVIVGDKLIPCQKLIEIENLDPPSGTLIIRSSIVGVIGQKPIKQEREFISLSPSLTGRDMSGNTEKIEVIHQACGQINGILKSVDDIETIAGSISIPLYDGDTSVTVLGATSGAYVELRDQNGFLDSGTAPFNPTGKTNMVFSHFGKLNKNQKIHLYFKYCGKEGENGEVQVVALPELISLAPNSVDQAIQGTSPSVNLLVNGRNFVQGATIVWNNQQQLPTTFWSSNQLEATLSYDNLKTAGKIPVKVVNPDGTKSQKSLTFTINELDIVARLTISVGNGWDPPAPVIKSATFNVTTPLPLGKTESFSVPANSQGECVLDYNKSGYPQGTYTVKASVVMDPAGATPLPGPNPEPIKNWRWNTPTQVVIFTVDQNPSGPVINEH